MRDLLAIRVATRLATRKLTEQFILRRESEIAAFRQNSYAAALNKVINAEKARQPPHTQPVKRDQTTHIAFKPNENNRLQNNINGKEKQTEGHDNTQGIEKSDTAGWTVVTRRKPAKQVRTQGARLLTKSREDLLAQGRCFRCLEKGHRSFQCRGKLKCLKCGQIGHKAGRCAEQKTEGAQPTAVKPQPTTILQNTERVKNATEGVKERLNNTEVINAQPITPETHPTINQAFVLVTQTQEQTKEHEMDMLADWENMPLTDAAYMQDGRVDDVRVFLPKRNTPNPATEFLDRSAIIMTGPNQNDAQLIRRITNKLARQFSRHPRQFEVSKIPASTGDLIAIFPNRDMMKQALNIGVFILSPGVQVQMKEYSRHAGMSYDPSTHKARLKIHDLPFDFWTWEDLSQMVSGFGTLERFAPVFTNGNYSELKVLVGCYHPTKIPPYVTTTEDPHTITCQIELEGWLHNDVLRIEAPHTGSERSDRNHPNEGEDEGAYGTNEWRRGLRNWQSSSFDSRAASGPVTQYNRTQRKIGQGMDAINQLEGAAKHGNGEVLKFKIGDKMMSLTGLNFSCFSNKYVLQGMSINGDQSTKLYVEILQATPEQLSIGTFAPTRLVIEWISMGNEKKAEGQLERVQHQLSLMDITGHTDYAEREESQEETGQQHEGQKEVQQQHNSQDKKIQREEEGTTAAHEAKWAQMGLEEVIQPQETEEGLMDGPPPGFSGPPKFLSPLRRSPRLSEKNKGMYMSPEERARLVSKPNSAQLPKGGPRKKNSVCQAQLQYYKNYEPLTDIQADLVVMAAGIETQGGVADRVDALLAT